MAKISDDARKKFANAIKPYQSQIDEILEKEKEVLSSFKDDEQSVEYKKIELAENIIFASTLYMAQNSLSAKILGVKNNDALNDARKTLYKAIILFEEVVTNFIDVSYSDLSDNWEKITELSVVRRYLLMRKLGLAIQLLEDAFGDNSKWKWSFVELKGRFSVVAKNIIDMKQGSKDYFEPNSNNYEVTILYVRMIQKLLDQSASGYRDKYELSTRRIDDMQNAIRFLLARHKLCLAIGDRDNAEEIKKKAAVWKSKLDADQKSGASS
ncbi:MAG: hypothetical protein IJR49_01865 [Treponema sp.]|nr:hypothetical protein [Treponema sp.]